MHVSFRNLNSTPAYIFVLEGYTCCIDSKHATCILDKIKISVLTKHATCILDEITISVLTKHATCI